MIGEFQAVIFLQTSSTISINFYGCYIYQVDLEINVFTKKIITPEYLVN